MMAWFQKVPGLKGMVEAEKSKRTVSRIRSVCIHGESDCVRCASEDFASQSDQDRNVWINLEDKDLRRIVMSLSFKVREAIRRNPEKVVLAGGYIRALVANELVHDVDLFVSSEKEAKSTCQGVKLLFKPKDLCLSCDDKGTEVQVVWRYPFKTPIDVPNQFDYTVSKAAVWFSEGDKNTPAGFRRICHERFYVDIARKVLVYDSIRDEEQATGFPRLLKYTTYGYSIEPESLAEVITRMCLSMNFDQGFDGLKKQLCDTYKAMGTDEDWEKLNTKYVKPKPKPKLARSHDYSYGS